jgi:hypothetical protein
MAHHRRYPRIVTPTPAPSVMDWERIWEDDCDDEPHDPWMDDECWQCGGEGWGVVGNDWDSDDSINGPYPGEVQRCPCCRGSGKAKDCWYW